MTPADVLSELGAGRSMEEGLQRALRRLIALTGATAGALQFRPERAEPLLVSAGRGHVPAALEAWLRRCLAGPAARGTRLARAALPGVLGPMMLLRAPLGPPRRGRGELALVGRRRRAALPTAFYGQLGSALEQAWRLHQRALRARALTEITRLGASDAPLDVVYRAFAESAASVVVFDSIGLSLVDAERKEFTIVDLPARTLGLGDRRDARMPLEATLLARVLASGTPVRVNDLAAATVPPRSRETFAARGYRSAILAPLVSRGGVTGAVTLASRRAAAFTDADVDMVVGLTQALASAIEQRRLLAENRRRADEARALLEAGRAVIESLDVQQTIGMIMAQARNVLGAASCGVFTLDPTTGDLVGVASLDLPPAMVGQIRLKPGEGIGGRAFAEQRPVQSEDLHRDERVRFRDLTRTSPLRSMLAVPLRVGDRAIGVIYVFRGDVHRFSTAEERLLLAFADQAAIALEHARLYEHLEAMVAERTRELDTQKRFVEVVVETLPLGVFVLDGGLRVLSANRHGTRVLGSAESRGRPVAELVPAEQRERVRAFLAAAFSARRVSVVEEEMVVGDETRIFRLTAAPIEPAAEHLVLLVEDMTLAKRLERQMLLTERLTTAGRLAAGVAHELNNPLATIAGCAEALRSRTRDGALAELAGMEDFRRYLGLIEDEAYRCKEITASLLHFVREPGSRRAATDLNALVTKTIELLSHQSRFKERRFLTELDPALPPVTANEGQLRQVFLGIAANALEAMGDQGTLRIRSRRLREEVEVEFEDEGPGLPDEIVGRIFDPFFTTKPPGQGTGLGLAIAQGIVTDHGGRIEVTSRVGKGCVFRVVLPLS